MAVLTCHQSRPIAVLGLVGAVLVIAAALLARGLRGVALVLLLVGVLPLAAVTWWSIVTPLLAVVALLLAIPVLCGPKLAQPRA